MSGLPIDLDDPRFRLGAQEMDSVHRELTDLGWFTVHAETMGRDLAAPLKANPGS
ncbi:hypothetical protein [Thiocapsa marina]|uniref:Uncharacterized protein n=1 Tax=Thiocapsa marina 5811 TaxID=768671 RepID=F9UBE6_9GAMM|nr:hypothetical protein [Thiocapsa marina]EGV18264.1 hypothetical protein ThimaDRAFT_2248 [Thiocapsa marina 5811]